MSSFTKKLLDGFAWRIGVYLSAFILNILVASYLGAGAGGEFYLLISNLTYIILFFTAGMDGAIGFFNARREIIPGQLFFISIVWAIFATLVIAGIYSLLEVQHILTPQLHKIYILLFISGNLLANFLSTLIYSLHNNKVPNIIFTVVNILLIIFVAAQKYSGSVFSANDFLPWYLLSGPALAVLFMAWLFLKKIIPVSSLPPEIYRSKFFQFAARTFFFSLLYALLLRCDYWLVDFFCAQKELGNYIQTTKLNQVILFIPVLASFTLFPLIVSQIQTEKDVEKKIISLINIYFFISLGLCIVLAAVGWWGFPLLYGKTYSEMYKLFLILAPGLVMLACTSPLSIFFSGHNQLYFNIKAITIAIVIMVIADIIFIPTLGVYGAALGSTIAYSAYFIILLFSFKNRFRFSYKELYNVKTLQNSLRKITIKTGK